MNYDNKRKNISMFEVSNGHISSMRVSERDITELETLLTEIKGDFAEAQRSGQKYAGKVFLGRLADTSRAKFANPDKAPNFFLRYIPSTEVREFSGNKPAPDDEI